MMAFTLSKLSKHLQLRGKTLPHIFLALWLEILKHPSPPQWNGRVKLSVDSSAYPPFCGGLFNISYNGANMFTKKSKFTDLFFLFGTSSPPQEETCLTSVNSLFFLSPSSFWSTISWYFSLLFQWCICFHFSFTCFYDSPWSVCWCAICSVTFFTVLDVGILAASN